MAILVNGVTIVDNAGKIDYSKLINIPGHIEDLTFSYIYNCGAYLAVGQSYTTANKPVIQVGAAASNCNCDCACIA